MTSVPPVSSCTLPSLVSTAVRPFWRNTLPIMPSIWALANMGLNWAIMGDWERICTVMVSSPLV